MQVDWNNVFNTWYMWLSSLNAALAEPIRGLSNGIGIPFLSAFLFGVLGTTAPCQLSTNFGALAFLTRRPSDRAATLRATLAYIAAKVLVYTLLGVLVLLVGRQLFNSMGGYITWARRIIGPGMILLGLAVLGVIRVRFQFGQRLARRIEKEAKSEMAADARSQANIRVVRRRVPHVPQQGTLVPFAAGAGAAPTGGRVAGAQRATAPVGSGSGAAGMNALDGIDPMAAAPSARSSFLLGLGFSLAFCPTLLLLFFGVVMALAARSAGGVTFPAFFALGTALPLFVFVGLALTSAGAAARFRKGMRRANKPLRWIGAAVLILIGLQDTLIYWFI